MAIYNTSNITAANTMYDYYVSVNQLSSGLFASFFLFVLFLVILFVFKGRYDIPTIMLGDSFVCLFLAVLMSPLWLNLVGYSVVAICAVLFFGSVFAKMFNGN